MYRETFYSLRTRHSVFIVRFARSRQRITSRVAYTVSPVMRIISRTVSRVVTMSRAKLTTRTMSCATHRTSVAASREVWHAGSEKIRKTGK